MKLLSKAFFVVVLAIVGVCAQAQDRPGAAVVDEVEAIATVEAVDRGARSVTLRGPKGNVVTIRVPHEAQNFDQIAVGDKVLVRYVQALAIFIGAPGSQVGADQADTVVLAPKGAPAGGIVASVTEVRARVEGIDYRERWADLRGPEGRLVRVDVPEDVKRFNEVKVGDVVVVRYSEAVGLLLEKQ